MADPKDFISLAKTKQNNKNKGGKYADNDVTNDVNNPKRYDSLVTTEQQPPLSPPNPTLHKKKHPTTKPIKNNKKKGKTITRETTWISQNVSSCFS